jgi:oxygen-dependent protoporphyrinogen oxidase
MSSKKTAVIGAGITGLTAAWQMQELGSEVEIFEKNSEPGGAVRSVKQDGWLTEYGPNTLLLKDRVVRDFIRDIGLEHGQVTANESASKRFIVRDGELKALPSSMKEAITTSVFGTSGKLRVALEPFIPRYQGEEESVASFVERRLGREILDYGLNPFVAGIYANRPEYLSLKHAFPAMYNLEKDYRSLIWGAIAGSGKRKEDGRIPRKLISFSNGLQQLPEKIAENLTIHYSSKVESVQKKTEGWFLRSEKGEVGPYGSIIVNVPVYQWSSELLPVKEYSEDLINEINYPPLSVLHLGFRKEDIRHPLDGFGFLVPEKEQRNILGALFSSTLFDGRAPRGYHLLTVFIGGGREPQKAKLPTEHLVTMAEEELRELTGLTGVHCFKEHVYWPKAIPGYHIGYGDMLGKFDAMERENPGLYLAGNFRHGISVPDCIKNGLALGKRVQAEI